MTQAAASTAPASPAPAPAKPYVLAKPLRDAYPTFAPSIDNLCAAIVKGTTPDITVLQGNACFFPYSPWIKQYDFGDGKGQVGFSAAHIYESWGEYDVKVTSEADMSVLHLHVSVQPDKRKELQVPDGADLKSMVEGLTEPTSLLLHAGGTYPVPGAINCNMADVHIAAAGPGPMPRLVRTGTPYSTIVAWKPRLRVSGLEFDSERTFDNWGPEKLGYNAFVPRAPGCAFVGNVVRNIDIGVQCWPESAGGMLIQANRFTRELRADGVFAMGGNLCIYSNVFEDSQQEDLIRVSDPNLIGLNIVGNVMTNDNSSKGTWSLRVLKEGVYIANNDHFTYARIGQYDPHNPVVASVRNIVVRLNRFFERLDANVNGSHILLDGAWDLTITQNQWYNWHGRTVAMMGDGPCKNVQFKHNTRVPAMSLGAPVDSTRPFVSRTKLVDPAGIIESGNTTASPAAPPIVVPPRLPTPVAKKPPVAAAPSVQVPASTAQSGS